MVSSSFRIGFIALAVGAALALAGCGGDGDGDGDGDTTSPTSTSAATLTSTPTGEQPSESPTSETTPEPDATGEETEEDRAMAAAEAIFGGTGGPDCVPSDATPVCIIPQPSLGSLDRGIASFGISDYPAGGAAVFLGKTPDDEWGFWFGTQDITYRLTVLPGEMLVCAGGTGLNLRASPSADGEPLDLLADETVVAVDSFVLTEPGMTSPSEVEAGYGWYHLRSPEEGWAYSKYLSDVSLGDCSVHDSMEPN